MKRNNLLTIMLSFCLSTTLFAQKAEEYQNSYNVKRALEILQNDGDQNEAMTFLQTEVEEHPKNGYAYYMMGYMYLDHDMVGDAVQPINRAIELLRKDKPWLSYAYRQRAKINVRLGNEKAALDDLNMAVKTNPKDEDLYSDRAYFYYQRDMYAESDTDYEKICSLQPGNTLGYMGKGRNALEQERYKEAIEFFSYCINLDPSFSQAYAFRAEANIRQGNVDGGIDDIIKALDCDAGNEKAYYWMLTIGEPEVNTLIAKLNVQQAKQSNKGVWSFYLGVVYEGQCKYNKAIDAYKASKKVEENVAIYGQIASCYSELGYYEQALENINMAIGLDYSDDEDYVGQKADLLYDMGREKEAIEAYGDYIKIAPESWVGYYRRGFMKDNLGDTDGAIEDYSTAIVLKPDYAYAYLGRGDMYLLKGNKEAAMKDYQMVVELDTVVGENNCAQFAYWGLGKVEEAKSLEYAILAKSASMGNYYDAACLFARMGEKETALNFLKESLAGGFRRFSHIRNDDDLDMIRDMEGYKALMKEYEAIYQEEQKKRREEGGLAEPKQEFTCEIPFTVESGNCYVNCKINELPMRFVFDTGASDVSLSMVEASFMMKNGYLSERDVMGNVKFSDAVGNVSEGTVINLRKVQFGDVELDNVRASVVRNQKAPLLLGQTVLSRVGKIEIDNQRKVLKVKYMK